MLKFGLRTDQARVQEDVLQPLIQAHNAVHQLGGKFILNQLFRTRKDQEYFYAKYKSGSGAPAQRPGYSVHESGRAMDVSTSQLNFPVPADKQIDVLWDAVRQFGWRPVIDRADETRVERWHFDYWGPWDALRAEYGYNQAARAAVLDVTGGQGPEEAAQAIQAQLWRRGFPCGAIDGVLGDKTKRALVAAGFSADLTDPTKLY
jgi:hypothetical protein